MNVVGRQRWELGPTISPEPVPKGSWGNTPKNAEPGHWGEAAENGWEGLPPSQASPALHRQNDGQHPGKHQNPSCKGCPGKWLSSPLLAFMCNQRMSMTLSDLLNCNAEGGWGASQTRCPPKKQVIRQPASQAPQARQSGLTAPPPAGAQAPPGRQQSQAAWGGPQVQQPQQQQPSWGRDRDSSRQAEGWGGTAPTAPASGEQGDVLIV